MTPDPPRKRKRQKNESPDVPMDLSAPDRWADESERTHWRSVVAERLDSLRTSGKTKINVLEGKDPEKAAQALYMIAEGASSHKVAKKLGLTRITVDRLRYNNVYELSKRRADLADRFTGLAEQLAIVTEQKLELLREDEDQLKNTSLRDLVISMGITSDHAARMAGIATTIVEHRSGPSVEDYQQMIETARARLKDETPVIEAEIVNDAEGTQMAEA